MTTRFLSAAVLAFCLAGNAAAADIVLEETSAYGPDGFRINDRP